MPKLTRRSLLHASCLLLLQPLSAGGKTNIAMKNGIALDVVLYSFFNRPIFDIHLNGTNIGVAGAYGGTSIVTEVSIPYGKQYLSWRLDGPEGMAGNGDSVAMKNIILIQPDQIPKNTLYMGVYLYPDNTAEVRFSQHIPGNSKRGEAIFNQAARLTRLPAQRGGNSPGLERRRD